MGTLGGCEGCEGCEGWQRTDTRVEEVAEGVGRDSWEGWERVSTRPDSAREAKGQKGGGAHTWAASKKEKEAPRGAKVPWEKEGEAWTAKGGGGELGRGTVRYGTVHNTRAAAGFREGLTNRFLG